MRGVILQWLPEARWGERCPDCSRIACEPRNAWESFMADVGYQWARVVGDGAGVAMWAALGIAIALAASGRIEARERAAVVAAVIAGGGAAGLLRWTWGRQEDYVAVVWALAAGLAVVAGVSLALWWRNLGPRQ